MVQRRGTKITRLKVGGPICGYVLWGGGFDQSDIATAGEVAIKPKSLNYVEAASVPLVALTAWQGLIDAAQLSAGPTALIQGGSGGVGTMATPIATARGAGVSAAAPAATRDLVKASGADVAVD